MFAFYCHYSYLLITHELIHITKTLVVEEESYYTQNLTIIGNRWS